MVYVETDAEKIARLEHYLAECYRLTGADPDGAEDFRLANHAVHEVQRLRAECDELGHAGQEALIALAVFKITDTNMPYPSIGPDLRKQILDAHDLLLKAL